MPCYIKGVQKQPFADILQNRCSSKFCKNRRKTPLLESQTETTSQVSFYDFCKTLENTLKPVCTIKIAMANLSQHLKPDQIIT